MSTQDDMAGALSNVRSRIAAAALRAGRQAEEITLVAVGKTHPPEKLREVLECGQRDFGENRVQELLAKASQLPSWVSWHMIGHLQSNKIRKVLPVCSLIHGVDSCSLAEAIDRTAADLGLFPKILLEVNVAGEASKFGFSADGLRASLGEIIGLKRVSVEGLMTIPPPVADPGQARPYFAALRSLRDELAAQVGIPLPILSMGMTSDFEVAIEEGATHVRVGTAIFGSRPYPAQE